MRLTLAVIFIGVIVPVAIGAILFRTLKTEIQKIMSEHLKASAAAAAALLGPMTDKLNALETFVKETHPKIVAAAVQEALKQAEVDDEAAATIFDEVVAAAQKELDDIVIPAIDENVDPANPAPPPEPEPPLADG